jgi:signal transduction histidine kinase
VVVLQRPPWWNWKHTVAVCGLLLAILGMAVLWIRSLRQRVEQRTHELQVAMGRLEKETRVSATLAERDRLAAEIHDSVEQGLSAIVMQMEAASEVVNEPDEVKHYLTMVKNMAGFSRAEVQHAVWDMQSPLLENADLATALQRVAQEISAGDTPRVTVEIVGEVRRLASNVEHHLLRIAQEAITNAVKHGNPRTISLLLRYTEATVRLVVRDDGMGFDAQATSADGRHFGLHGMRSRAQKIDAALRINSEPGDGTCVELVVPVPTPVQHALQ